MEDQENVEPAISKRLEGTFVGTLSAIFTPSCTFLGGINERVLTVTHDGEFQWHDNADALIAGMEGTANQSCMHILKRLRDCEKQSS
jgi:hypothetical protein